jgi:hypothetical protein
MKEVFVHHDPGVVGLRKSILDQAGIACFIRNEYTSASLGSGIFGIVQSPVFDPVLCILDDERYDEALALLGGGTAPPPLPRADWQCAKCGETVPGNFAVCWNCASANREASQ